MRHILEQVLEASEVHPLDTVTLVPLTDDLRPWYRRLGFVDDPGSRDMILAVSTLRAAKR
jgi:hypothetical protein